MKGVNFSDKTQWSFWGNVDYPSNIAARKARDAMANKLKKLGLKISTSCIRDQQRKYSTFGHPDGTIGHVYKIDVRGN